MRNINYKSDFSLFQSIFMTQFNKETKKWEKVDIGFPQYDFKLYYYTASRSNAFVAHCKYDSTGTPHCVNCMKTEDERLLVLFNDHGLNCGDLKVEIDIEIPNKIFQDGYQKEVIPGPTGTLLWDRPTEGYGPAEAEALLPFIKGESFKFEDFTPEQLEELTDKAGQMATENASEKIQEIIDGNSEQMKESFDRVREEMERELSEFVDITDEEIEALWADSEEEPEEEDPEETD